MKISSSRFEIIMFSELMLSLHRVTYQSGREERGWRKRGREGARVNRKKEATNNSEK